MPLHRHDHGCPAARDRRGLQTEHAGQSIGSGFTCETTTTREYMPACSAALLRLLAVRVGPVSVSRVTRSHPRNGAAAWLKRTSLRQASRPPPDPSSRSSRTRCALGVFLLWGSWRYDSASARTVRTARGQRSSGPPLGSTIPAGWGQSAFHHNAARGSPQSQGDPVGSRSTRR